MIILLSPAKTLDYKSAVTLQETSTPYFQKEADSIAATMKKFNQKQLTQMMNISLDLAQLNIERYQNWEMDTDITPQRQAIYAYKGDVYLGLDAYSWGKEQMEIAQKNVRILSGLYGYLRPIDLIKPYRLEMGTTLKVKNSSDLYAFWKTKITSTLKKEIKQQANQTVINLASNEYAKAIDFKSLKVPVISPQFLDFKNGQFKMISFFAKKARGMMAAYLTKYNIQDPAHIIGFSQDGYLYNSSLSTEAKPVFTRS